MEFNQNMHPNNPENISERERFQCHPSTQNPNHYYQDPQRNNYSQQYYPRPSQHGGDMSHSGPHGNLNHSLGNIPPNLTNMSDLNEAFHITSIPQGEINRHQQVQDKERKIWLDQWKLHTSNQLDVDLNAGRNCVASKLKLQDVAKDVQQCKSFLQQIKIYYEKINATDDPIEFKNLTTSVQQILEQLDYLRCKLKSEVYCKKVKELVAKRRKKRFRARSRKKLLSQSKHLRVEKWKEKEKLIDDWRHNLIVREKEERQSLRIKKEADSVLGEIRKKIQESKDMMKVLDKLSLLREARLKKGEAHGYVTTSHSTVNFNNVIENLRKLLIMQESHYDLEKQALSVMLEETTCSVVPQLQRSSLSNTKSKINSALFGDKQLYYSKEILECDTSLEALVKIRSNWDIYICAAENPLGTSIPTGWVEPPLSPDDNWKLYQT